LWKIRTLGLPEWYTTVVLMALPMSRPFKHPKTGVYWLRKRVPDDLRAAVGFAEYKRTLKTKDPVEAKRVHAAMLAELEAHWAVLRLSPPQPDASPAGHALPAGRPLPWAADDHGSALFYLQLGAQLKVPEETDAPLSSSEQGRRWMLKAVAAEAQHAKQYFEKVRAAPSLPAAVSAGAASLPVTPSVTFDSLMKGWEAERKPLPKTSYEYRRVIRDLRAFLGHDDAGKLTSGDVVKWKAHLVEGELHPKTIKDAKLAPLRAILQWGADNNHLPSNPASRVTIEVKQRAGDGKRGFSDDEATLILRAAFAEKDGAKKWIPILGAYSGARVAELAQLRVGDVVEISGVHCFRITPDAGPLKTRSSERIVPLHPAVVEAGFLKFVQGVKQGPLFPSMKPDVFGSRGGNATKILGRWVRGLGLTDERLSPNHSWRHRFKTLCRRHGLAIDIANAITGHLRKTVADGYGEFPPEALYREIEKIPVIGVAKGERLS
jgi:integrase